MENAQIKQDFLRYLNEHCTDDPPYENILAGEVMQDSDNMAHAQKMSQAYGLANELLTDDEYLSWDEDTRTWSIGQQA